MNFKDLEVKKTAEIKELMDKLDAKLGEYKNS